MKKTTEPLQAWISSLSRKYDRHLARELKANVIANFDLEGFTFYLWANDKGILAKPGNHAQAHVTIKGSVKSWLAVVDGTRLDLEEPLGHTGSDSALETIIMLTKK